MARDTQIVSSADHAAPKDYTIPGNAELILRAVQATFTDNGASGAWLPCVTLISDSGHTIARAIDRGVQITAGSDASVSWFPGVKGTSAGLSAISVSLDVGTGTFAAGSNTLPIQSFSTNDAGLFSVPNPGSGIIDIHQDCSLLAVGRLSFSPAYDITTNTVLTVIGAPATGFSGDIAAVPGDAGNTFHTSFLDGSTVLAVFAGDSSGLQLQLDGPINNVTGAGLALIKLTGSQLF